MMTATAAATDTPTRDQVPEMDRWDLSHLYSSVDQWQAHFDAVQAELANAGQFKGKLGGSPAALLEVLEYDKRIDLQLERLYHFASLQLAEEASNNDYLDRASRIQNLASRWSEALSYIRPEIQGIPDPDFARFLQDEGLAEWKVALEKIRRFKPHTLSPQEEKLLAMAGPALRGHGGTFSQLTNVDINYGKVEDASGQLRPLTQSSLSSFLISSDREVRRRAFHTFYEQIRGHQYTLASSLASSVKGDVFRARARNYPSALEAALFPDAIPVEVYDNLLSTVRSGLPVIFRYFELRRKVLGVEKLHFYDTYVPMVAEIDRRTSFDDAVNLVLESLHPLGGEYVDALEAGFRSRWVDRYESKGKRSGAFSSSSYGSPPYILMNYKEDVFSDVYTLTHEAGHSMHSWYSQRHQPFQYYNYPIFLAEVASTFNEMLLTHHLLETTEDRRMRAYLLNRQLDDLRGTLIRQTMFAEFEKEIHAVEEQGGGLTLERFRKIYRSLLEDYFGSDFVLDEDLEFEGLRIPHFYSAFYVYKYATGISAAVALSEKVLQEGAPAVERYLGFLKSGDFHHPLETLEKAGVDMRSPAPVQAALGLFERRLAELEELCG